MFENIKNLKEKMADFRHPNTYELKEYVIKDGQKHPFALICPGGGYSVVASFVEGRPFAEKLNEMGYSAFVLYYHVKEQAKYPAPQEDVARALREIFTHAEEYHLITEGYSIWGSSAGGHLVASFGTEHMGYAKYELPKPGTLVLVYPVITMGEKTHEGSRKNHLGKDATQEQMEFASVEKHVTENYPPTFVWCGSADTTVHPDNSRMLAQELERCQIPYEFVEYSEVGHGVGLGKEFNCEPWFEKAVAFWKQNM